MKTISDLKKEVEKTNLTFNEINPSTIDFEGFEFLNDNSCTLLKKISENIFIISFYCEDTSNVHILDNGTYKVITSEDYIYDVIQLRDDQSFE